jgi:hypothetical protein
VKRPIQHVTVVTPVSAKNDEHALVLLCG